MFSHEIQIRVRYSETDKMGYVYYGHYASFYEQGRVEALRALAVSYKSLEDSGIWMPVLNLECTFVRPAKYDDLLTLRTRIKLMPTVRILFEYELFNESEDLIHYGKTALVFLDAEKQKPIRAPRVILDVLQPYFVKH